MSDGTIIARHYATGSPARVRWQSGHFSEIAPVPDLETSNLYIAPSLVDLQINGFGGIDFQQDTLSEKELLVAAGKLQSAGCIQFLCTFITDDWPRLMSRLAHVRRIRQRSVPLRRAIAGWHIEGPFLSPEPGFAGAHDPSCMCDPDPNKIHELRRITGDDPVLLTLAPERPGAIAAIRLAVSLGMKVSIGHANPSASVLADAIEAGVSGFTHLGNACPQTLDRHDNLLWRVFDSGGVTAGLIPDTIHVSPALFRLVHKVVPENSIYYTTDAMAAGGAPPGRYTIGAIELEVGPDQIVRQPGKTNFAGSALRPIEGVIRAAQMLHTTPLEVWDRFSTQPARFMELQSGIELGNAANFCCFRLDENGRLTELQTFSSGSSQSD